MTIGNNYKPNKQICSHLTGETVPQKTKNKADKKNSDTTDKIHTAGLTYGASSQDLLANYNMANINFISKQQNQLPQKLDYGVNKFEHDGAKFNIFVDRHGHKHSQIVSPHPTDPGFFDQIKGWDINDREIPNINNEDTDTDYDAQVNGEIDEAVSQGNTGDCWLISAVLALNSTETGKAVIKNSITANDDGSVTVNFKGLNVSYTISASEIKQADTDNNTTDSYTNGDNDMLVLELATEKLKNAIARGEVTLPEESGNFDECETYSSSGIEGGYSAQMVYFLTGIASDDKFSGETEETLKTGFSQTEIYEVLQNALDSGNTSLTFGLYFGTHSAKCTNGEYYSINLDNGGHALAITNVTDSTVTFVNPWDSTTTFTMTWEEFANLGVGCISSTDLSSIAGNYANDDESIDEVTDNEYIINDNVEENEGIVPAEDDTTATDIDIDSLIERLQSGDLTVIQDLENAGINCTYISRQRDNVLVRVDFEYNGQSYSVNIDTEDESKNFGHYQPKPRQQKFHLYDKF